MGEVQQYLGIGRGPEPPGAPARAVNRDNHVAQRTGAQGLGPPTAQGKRQDVGRSIHAPVFPVQPPHGAVSRKEDAQFRAPRAAQPPHDESREAGGLR